MLRRVDRRIACLHYCLLLVTSFGVSSTTYAQTFQGYNGEFSESVKITYHQAVAMRDGVDLATDIYLPEADGRFPTLLVRDIYSNGSASNRQQYARFATENGYAFVFQSARGRYDSDGHWYPYFQEITDGDDTLTWISNQPWSNGKVGMFGTSYLASVQWLAALSGNSALRAIAPAMSPGNYYRDVAYPGGAFSLLSRARWGIGMVGGRTTASFAVDWINGIDHLPLETLAQSVGFNVRHFQDWLDHPSYDAYWKPLNLEARANEMRVPALNIGGWYDVFLRSTIGSYKTMTGEAATQTAREGQRLIIGPWPHGWNVSQKTGDLDFGASSLVNVEELLLEWFDYWLKDGSAPSGAPIKLFIMGDNVWREEQEWPLARTQYKEYYLHANKRLASEKPTGQSGSLQYLYDPENPVPTLGGNIMEPSLRGPYDQAPLDGREDVLRFVTEAFTEQLEITGPIRAELYAASDSTDTDFMTKLVLVKADGVAINLVDGVIRARFRNGFDEEQLIEPDVIYQYSIDMWATSYVLSPGDRLRIDVTSSNFPRLARNLNTGAEFARTTEMKTAKQTIYMTEKYPSHVVIPIVPR